MGKRRGGCTHRQTRIRDSWLVGKEGREIEATGAGCIGTAPGWTPAQLQALIQAQFQAQLQAQLQLSSRLDSRLSSKLYSRLHSRLSSRLGSRPSSQLSWELDLVFWPLPPMMSYIRDHSLYPQSQEVLELVARLYPATLQPWSCGLLQPLCWPARPPPHLLCH